MPPKKKKEASCFDADSKLKAAAEHQRRQRELSRNSNIPKHILRLIGENGGVNRIKCHKEDNLEQLHYQVASIFELEAGSFVIGLHSERTDSDFRSSSQLNIGRALKKGTKIYLHKLTDVEREELPMTMMHYNSKGGDSADTTTTSSSSTTTTTTTMRAPEGLFAIHSMEQLKAELSSPRGQSHVAVCFTANFEGDAAKDSRDLTNLAAELAGAMTFLSVHVRSGGETEEGYLARELGVNSFPHVLVFDSDRSISTPTHVYQSVAEALTELTQNFEAPKEETPKVTPQMTPQQDKTKNTTKEMTRTTEEDENVANSREESDKQSSTPPPPPMSTTVVSPLPPASISSESKQQSNAAATSSNSDLSISSSESESTTNSTNSSSSAATSAATTTTTTTTTTITEYTTKQLHDLALQQATNDKHIMQLREIVGTETCSIAESFYLLYELQNRNFNTEKHLVDFGKAVDKKVSRTESTAPLGYTLPIQKILPLEIQLLGKMDSSTKKAIASEPVLRDMQDMVVAGLLSMEDVQGFQAQLKSGCKPEEVAHAVQSLLRRVAVEQREKFQQKKFFAASERFQQLYNSKEIRDKEWKLNWSNKPDILKRYTGLRVHVEDEIVGLRIVKDHIERLVGDATGRVSRDEELPRRHHVLVGRLGTGRKTTANLIGWLYSCLSGMKGDPNVEAAHHEAMSVHRSATATSEERQVQHTMRLIGPQVCFFFYCFFIDFLLFFFFK